MKIYVTKPNSLHPDAMFYLKEKAQKTKGVTHILENQSGPAYDASMINRCDALYAAVGIERSIGKGVFGEIEQAQNRKIPVKVFEYNQITKELAEIKNFKTVCTDENNFRQYGKIDGNAVNENEEEILL